MARRLSPGSLLLGLLRAGSGSSDDGWATESSIASLAPSQHCTIDRIPFGSLTASDFEVFYQERYPVILEGSVQTDMAARTEKAELLREHSDTVVTLSSANAISHLKIQRPLSEYLKTMAAATRGSSRSNSTFYLFGPPTELSVRLASLVATYRRPVFAGHDVALSFGIGPAGSGVPFHVHGHGFSEVIHGSKRWFLYPPHHKPPFDPDESMLVWLQDVLPTYQGGDLDLLEQCDIRPGDVLYFPSMWWHAVINLSETVFVSSFEQDNKCTDERFWL